MSRPQAAPRSQASLARPRSLLTRRPRIALAIAIVVVAGAAAGGWVLTRPGTPAAPSYRIVPALRTDLQQTLSTTGYIEAADTKELAFSASGQVTSVAAYVGQQVGKGQILAKMDSAELRAQVAQAKASLAAAQSRLSQDEAASTMSSTQLTADQASVRADQAQVHSAETALGGATLTSPINGVVVQVGLTNGEQLGGGGGGAGSGQGSSGGGSPGGGSSGGGSSGGGSSGGGSSGGGGAGSSGAGSGAGSSSAGSSGSQSIMVVSTREVIDASVDATEVGQIKAGDAVIITTGGRSGPVRGTVSSIGLVADTSSGVATFPVVINIPGTPSGLYQGAQATVSIIYKKVSGALAVPTAAVRPGPRGTVVSTVVHGRQVTRPVTTGITAGGLTQITSGLASGEPVVVPIQRLSGVPGGFKGPGGGVFIGPGGGFPGGQVVRIGPGGGPKGGRP